MERREQADEAMRAATREIRRVDVVSDTHSWLSHELLESLDGADAILHAGDLCSPLDYDTLNEIAPTFMALGNNDWSYEYKDRLGKGVRSFTDNVRITLFGLVWEICHYRERLRLDGVDVGICGHTHRPFIESAADGVLLMNPGSTTYPRTSQGPTFGRIIVQDGAVLDASIEELPKPRRPGRGIWR